MEIIVGKTSGFCGGVDYTINKAKEELTKTNNIYCIGEIVHNENVIKKLESIGLITVKNIDEIPNKSKIIIRAHGEIKETYDKAIEKELKIIDLTCGKIKAIKSKIKRRLADYFIVIIGKKNHPEPLGIKSFSGNNSFIIENKEDIADFLKEYNNSKINKIYVIAQTTFNNNKFDEIVNCLKNNIKDEIFVEKTICNATSNRQKETNELSKVVDKMIIVGGINSSNTKELEVISSKNCKHVFLIQDKNNLDLSDFNITDKVGIMGGASTPKNIVDEVVKSLKEGVK